MSKEVTEEDKAELDRLVSKSSILREEIRIKAQDLQKLRCEHLSVGTALRDLRFLVDAHERKQEDSEFIELLEDHAPLPKPHYYKPQVQMLRNSFHNEKLTIDLVRGMCAWIFGSAARSEYDTVFQVQDFEQMYVDIFELCNE